LAPVLGCRRFAGFLKAACFFGYFQTPLSWSFLQSFENPFLGYLDALKTLITDPGFSGLFLCEGLFRGTGSGAFVVFIGVGLKRFGGYWDTLKTRMGDLGFHGFF